MKTRCTILHYFNKFIILVYHPNLGPIYMKFPLKRGLSPYLERIYFLTFYHRKINIGFITRASSLFLTERERERERERATDRQRQTDRQREREVGSLSSLLKNICALLFSRNSENIPVALNKARVQGEVDKVKIFVIFDNMSISSRAIFKDGRRKVYLQQ